MSWGRGDGAAPTATKDVAATVRRYEQKAKYMTFQNILPAHPMQGFLDAARRLKSDMAEQRRRHAAYRQVFDELAAMSDRELADIGIARSDIERIATEALPGR